MDKTKPKAVKRGLSLHPLTLDDALRGAMETGPPPKKRKRNKKPRANAIKSGRKPSGSES